MKLHTGMGIKVGYIFIFRTFEVPWGLTVTSRFNASNLKFGNQDIQSVQCKIHVLDLESKHMVHMESIHQCDYKAKEKGSLK